MFKLRPNIFQRKYYIIHDKSFNKLKFKHKENIFLTIYDMTSVRLYGNLNPNTAIIRIIQEELSLKRI